MPVLLLPVVFFEERIGAISAITAALGVSCERRRANSGVVAASGVIGECIDTVGAVLNTGGTDWERIRSASGICAAKALDSGR